MKININNGMEKIMQSLKIRVILITLVSSLFFSQLLSASSLAGRVWLDLNRDGLDDSTEPGLAGLKLTLYSQDKIILSQMVTQDTGSYHFDGLPYSDYIVCLDPSFRVNYNITHYRYGEFEEIDNDVLPESGCTEFFRTNDSARDIKNIDLGLLSTDTTQVSLLSDEAVSSEAATIPELMVVSSLDQSNVVDSEAASGQGVLKRSGVSGSVSSLAGRVWLDINHDGRDEEDEPGIGDVMITLFDSNLRMLNQVVSKDTGEYEFTNLPYSDYIICLRDGISPVIDQITSYRSVGHEEFDNDAQLENGCTVFFRTNDSAIDIKNIDLGLTAITVAEQTQTVFQSTTRPSPVPVRPSQQSPQSPIQSPVTPTPTPVSQSPDQPTVRPSPVPTRPPVETEQTPPIIEVEAPAPIDSEPPIAIGESNITEIIDGITPGNLAAIPGSQLDFLRACPSSTDIDQEHAYLAAPNYKWNFYCAGVINAENGAAYDTKRNRMIVWGGGHADYAGNEVYAFNLGGPNPGWEHLNLPSPLPTNCDMKGRNFCEEIGSIEYLIKSPTEPDRLVPVSRHTLDTLQFLPNMGDQGSLWAYSGSVWQGGFVTSAVWTFDTADKNWTEHVRWDGSLPDPDPDLTARPDNILQGLDVFSVYDPTNGNIYAHGNRRLQQFNPVTQQWTLMTDDNNVSFTSVHSTAAYDYEHKKLVVIGGSSDYPITPSYYDIRSTGTSQIATYHDLVTTGENEIQYADAPGIAYEPDADVFVAWSGGKSVYVLDMETDTPNWEKVELEGDDPGNAAVMGTFGRLRYVPDKKVMMLVNRIAVEEDGFTLIKNQQQANVFFFRLPARFYNNGTAPEPIVASVVVTSETDTPVELETQTIKHLYPIGNIADALAELIAGDTLIIHEGEHLLDKFVQITAEGTAESPIIIKAAEGEKRPLISTQTDIVQNTFNLAGNASYITIKGLEITNGNHEDAVKMYGEHVSHITLEDLDLHNVSIGIRVATDADHLLIRNNHIHDTGQRRLDEFGSLRGFATGEGMYLGCHQGDCSLSDSVIENNLIHDSSPEAEQGDGIEMKTRSHDNVIRNNVVYNMGSKRFSDYGGILVWGWADAPDTEGWGDNIVEGNVVWGNVSINDVGIEAISHAKVRNNIVFNVHTGLASNPQFNGGLYLNIPVKDVDLVNNTVFETNIGARLIWETTENAVFANNIIHSADSIADSVALSCRTNLTGTFVKNVVNGNFSCEKPNQGFFTRTNLNALVQDVNAMNFWVNPSAFSLLGQGAAEYAPATDFNGSERGQVVDIGAYQTNGAATNPGWLIQAGQFKSQ